MSKQVFSHLILIASIILLVSSTKSLGDGSSSTDQSGRRDMSSSDYFKSSEKNQESSLSCAICKSSTSALHGILYYSKPLLVAILKPICYFTFWDWSICTGVLNQASVPFAKVVLDKLADKDYICGLAYKYCPSNYEYEDFDLWKKNLMSTKPKFVEKKPTSKSSYRVLQINDIHLDFDYAVDSIVDCGKYNCCVKAKTSLLGEEKDGKTKAGFWGSPGYECDLPPRTFDKVVAFIKETVKPDYIIWLGDNTDHRIYLDDPERHANFTKYVSQVFEKELSDIPIFPVLGNHELLPISVFDFESKKTPEYPLDEISVYWKNFLDKDAIGEFTKNGYYSTLLDKNKKVRVIAIFVGAYDELNWYLYAQNYDPGNMFTWQEQQQDNAEKNQEDVFILKHIPICESTNHAANKHLIALIDRYANNIRAVFAGHTHHDHLSFIKSQDGSHITTQFIGPSVTTFENGNPSFRVYEIDADTNVVMDYSQYRLDTEKWNKIRDESAKLTWDIAYNFLDEYQMKDLSSNSWKEFSDRFANNDFALVSKYGINYNSGVEKILKGFVYNKCNIETVDYDEWIECNGGDAYIKKLSSVDSIIHKMHQWFGKWMVKKSFNSNLKKIDMQKQELRD